MFTKFPSRNSQVLFLVGAFIFFNATLTLAVTVDGFRDLKFGMTQEEVRALEVCSNSSECLYDLLGKNRYLSLYYTEPPGSVHQPPPSSTNGKTPPTLARITIDMGEFTDESYGRLQMLLGDQFVLTHDLAEENVQAFTSEKISELVMGYENAQILLKIARRKFGNLVLKVVFQNNALAEVFNKKPK